MVDSREIEVVYTCGILANWIDIFWNLAKADALKCLMFECLTVG